MSHKWPLPLFAFFTSFLGFMFTEAEVSAQDDESLMPPNVVVFFTDDQGWGDLSCQGSEDIPTPNIDALADEVIRMTNFYTAQPVCSASRSSLLTGC